MCLDYFTLPYYLVKKKEKNSNKQGIVIYIYVYACVYVSILYILLSTYVSDMLSSC